jgi:cyclase
VIQVSEHAFVETKYLGCNVGIVLAEQGPVLIDTPALPGDARELRDQIHKLTGQDIIYLIYTHEHFDHVLGSAYLTNRIIAHQAAVSDIEYLKTNLPGEINHFFPDLYQQYQEVFDNVEVVSPQIVFSHGMTLHLGEMTMEMSHVGGHSPASIIVYLPEERVLFCGDIVDVGMPFVTPQSRFDEWITALQHIEAMEIDKIVPGHGELCDRETARRTRIYFETMRNRVQMLIKDGASKEEGVERIDLTDVLPIPPSDIVKQQVESTIGMMWEEVR